MATIKYIIEAIDKASRSLGDVANKAVELNTALDEVTRSTQDLYDRQVLLADSGRTASAALGHVRDTAIQAAAAQRLLTEVYRNASDEIAAAAAKVGMAAGTTNAASAGFARSAAGFAAAGAAASTAAGGYGKLRTAGARDPFPWLRDADKVLGNMDGKVWSIAEGTDRASRGFYGWFGFFRWLASVKIPLFGGMLGAGLLGSIGAWHLALDVVLELIAVIGPAAVALAALGFAGVDAFKQIQQQVQATNTVMDAFHRSVPGTTFAMEQLHHAVTPYIFQLYGDALLLVSRRQGDFARLAVGAGHAVDQLAARFVVAATNGGVLSQFLAKAVPDIGLLGTIIGNLGGILGAVFGALPGYAFVLFSFLAVLTHIVEVAFIAIEPLLRVGLAFHGVFIYAGLAVTVLSVVLRWVVALGGWFAQLAVKMIIFGQILAGIIAEEGVLSAMQALFEINPFFWVAAAIVAVIGLGIAIARTHSQTQDWINGLEQGLAKTSITNGLQTLISDQNRVTTSLVRVNSEMAKTPKYIASVARGSKVLSPEWSTLNNQAAVLRSGFQDLQNKAALYDSRVNRLAKTYGGVTVAQGLLVASGVTLSQMLKYGKDAWAQIQVQVEATDRAYRQMGYTGSALSNDMEILRKQANDQYQSIQKLTQGLDTFVSNFTGTQNTFDQWALDLNTTRQNYGKLTAAARANSQGNVQNAAVSRRSLNDLHSTYVITKTAIDGLTQADLQLNQSFVQTVIDAGKVMDTWIQAGIRGGLFNQGVKALISSMLGMAKGSQEAQAQLIGLAQIAGYRGPISMQALTAWLGHVHDATRTVKDITNQATIQEALLTTAMGAQGTYIANKLINDINDAAIAYGGVKQAAQFYGEQVAKFGAQSQPALTAQKKFIDALVTTEIQAGKSKNAIAAMITKILGIPLSRAIKLVLQASGSGAITLKEQMLGQNAHGFLEFHKRGALIGPGYGGGDRHLAMLEAGETVVPKHLTPMVAPLMKAHRVPGFTSGGFVGNPMGLANFASRVPGEAGDGMFHYGALAEKAATQAAVAAARKWAAQVAAAAFSAAAGPGGGSPGKNAALARSMYPAWASGAEWAAWNYVAMRESGWSQFARNPSSGAYGIPQALPFTKMPKAAWPASAGGSSNPRAQIGWMIGYIRGRYGDAINAAAHERAFNWYGRGGVISEPILGVGLRSGQGYGFGENGRETVVPGTGGNLVGTLVINQQPGESTSDTLDEVMHRLRVASRRGRP